MASSYLYYHVHGPCYVQVGTGASEALETLGMCKAGGARIRINNVKRPIHTDASGPNAPAVMQEMGGTHEVSLTLASWSETILTKLRKLAHAVPLTGTLGHVGAIGAILGVAPESGSPAYLFGQGTLGFHTRLALPAEYDDPWYWPTSTLANPESLMVSTEAGELQLAWTCWAAVGGLDLTARQKVLFARSLPA